MGKFIDLTGNQYGLLTVIKRGKNIGKATAWLCQCNCGNPELVLIRGDHLKNGATKSCGCLHRASFSEIGKKNKNNLLGQRFGRLVILEEEKERRYNNVVWKCQCDCGNIVKIPSSKLTSGHTQSCGCLAKETISNLFLTDLTGQTFGHLTVLKRNCDIKSPNGGAVWWCKCDCGQVVSIAAHNLKQGTISCGCIKSSIGEENIRKILDEEKIKYQTEYKFFELGQLRYDFYLPEHNRLIEFDGIQHFIKKNNSAWDRENKFENRQARDKIKNEYAISHNIPLVRIPYWERDNITIEMIMGDQYLIK